MIKIEHKMPGISRRIGVFFKQVKNRISRLFEPEEVEVTFIDDGKHVRYTYTKVEHKRVA